MRVSKSKSGLTVRAFAGTTGVLLAFDVDSTLRKGLLGFAIERQATGRKWEWLNGSLPWEGEQLPPGTTAPSSVRPFQKFRWSDYRVEPGASYAYRVRPVHGTPERPATGDAVTVRARAHAGGAHRVLFNRAAAASQAFSKKFPDVEARMEEARRAGAELDLPPEVREWLSRGVLESVVATIDRATGPTWGLDVAIYEYEHPEIVAAVNRAHGRGAHVRVVYHSKKGDEQTADEDLQRMDR